MYKIKTLCVKNFSHLVEDNRELKRNEANPIRANFLPVNAIFFFCDKRKEISLSLQLLSLRSLYPSAGNAKMSSGRRARLGRRRAG